ncbi:type 2 ribosome-inactivating protein [Cinnamomum micranthum f. kanehirae]|uniref:Type 2 ribosome-inactivating protein n=1 Tax=Cinnamomum micranthum f. kanehirae TaxID=337451 RepID=A0A443PKZ8_9MAGN|nr:type 2 ribosome-inactivating protein [Cinnamomum micranthum f. kanehirae]
MGQFDPTVTLLRLLPPFGKYGTMEQSSILYRDFVTSIVGFNDLCMQANGEAVWVVQCESSEAEQTWAVYPDGSIWPQQNRDRCLTSSDNHSKGRIIIISGCSSGSEGQRWVFMNVGTILNLKNGMVMEVKGSDPSLHQIIIWEVTENPNQKWLSLL